MMGLACRQRKKCRDPAKVSRQDLGPPVLFGPTATLPLSLAFVYYDHYTTKRCADVAKCFCFSIFTGSVGVVGFFLGTARDVRAAGCQRLSARQQHQERHDHPRTEDDHRTQSDTHTHTIRPRGQTQTVWSDRAGRITTRARPPTAYTRTSARRG